MIGIGDRDRRRSRVSFSSCPPLAEKCDWLSALAYSTDDCGNVTLSGRYNMGNRSDRKLVVAIQQAKLETDDERTSVKPAISRADEISSDPSFTGWRKPPFVTQPPFRYQPVLDHSNRSTVPYSANLETIDVSGASYRSALDRTAPADWAEVCMVGNPAFSLFERRE
ncbi:hypothetical protein ACIQUG_32055 [Ensifer sp. NPDC090286]|uniref:hypothetical protein n=1 Tax=Ensifer sp. NPDC090286 TaxID=3363991 RepID=UPI00383A22A2